MSKPVIIKNISIGDGIPKVCVPLVGHSRSELLEQMEQTRHVKIDLIEWRADYFQGLSDPEQVDGILGFLQASFPDKPILFTVRSAREHGEFQGDNASYASLIRNAVKTKKADLVDLELFSGDTLVQSLVQGIHREGAKVILSSHDFDTTPPMAQLLSRLEKMAALGADIAKIAVMPQCAEHVLDLLTVTRTFSKHAPCPLITMSMGGLGLVTRLTGELFGSSVTFGAVGQTSAPGQIDVSRLREVLDLFHSNLSN